MRTVCILLLQILTTKGLNRTSDGVQDFVQISEKSNDGLEAILMEPLFLEKLLREEERSVLMKHKLMPKLKETTTLVDEDGVQFITFGLFGNRLTRLQTRREEICEQWVGFQCEAVFRPIKQSEQKTFPKNEATHYFLLKNKTLIHLVVLFKRRHFLMIEALPQNNMKPFGIHIKDHLSFGSKEQAFDSFSLRKVLMPFYNITVSVPEEIDHFLAQMDSSEFIECPSYLNRTKQELPPISWSPLSRKAEKGLISMKQMMKKVKVPFWLWGGTLLGWYRECGIISYTPDVDFTTWAEYATPDITAKLKKYNNGLKMWRIFGIFKDGYQVRFLTRAGLGLDLFYVYKESESMVKDSAHMGIKYVYYYYPKFELCSADLLGHKMLVPCNPGAIVRAGFGPLWAHPVKKWSIFHSGFNVGPVMKWPHGRNQYQSFGKDSVLKALRHPSFPKQSLPDPKRKSEPVPGVF